MPEMPTTVERLSDLQRRVRVAVPIAQIESEVEKRLKRMARTARVPGFRPGKVPLKMIAQQYGPQVRSEALTEAVQESFNSVVQEQNLRVAGYPTIEPRQDGADPSLFEYIATFEVYPEVSLGDLSGTVVVKPVAEVTDEDVERTVEILRKQRTRYEPVERGAVRGDRVTVDFTGRIDGEEFAGGRGQDLPVVLGEGRVLPEFERAIEGLAPGATTSFPLTFPADYHGREVAGRTAEFALTVKAVGEPHLPEVDAEFARAFGVADGDLGKFREEVRANLRTELRRRLESRVRDQVMAALRSVAPVTPPRSLVEGEMQRLAQAARTDLQARGLDPQTTQIEMDQFREPAEQRVAVGLNLAEVVRRHGLTPAPEQVRALVEDAAQSYEQPQEVVGWFYSDKARLSEFEGQALERNVVDWVLKQARVEEQPATFEEIMGAQA
jgi:trigger factor